MTRRTGHPKHSRCHLCASSHHTSSCKRGWWVRRHLHDHARGLHMLRLTRRDGAEKGPHATRQACAPRPAQRGRRVHLAMICNSVQWSPAQSRSGLAWRTEVLVHPRRRVTRLGRQSGQGMSIQSAQPPDTRDTLLGGEEGSTYIPRCVGLGIFYMSCSLNS